MFRIILAVATAGLLGCHQDDALGAPGDTALTRPTRLCRAATHARSCRDVDDVEALLARHDLEILAVAAPPAGIQGARVLTLRTRGRHPVVFRAKWRAHSTTTRRNSPRLELAAYAVQKLFLRPGEYVVPPTAAHCFPIAAYRARVDRTARPTFRGAPCVYGVLSYWLEDVTSLAAAAGDGWFHGADAHALDPALFAENHAYRDSIARVNLFTYVIGHADTHARNFVITDDRRAPLVYSVDNSLSLGMAKNPRLQPRHDWSRLRVPSLPRATIERLRAADRELASLAAVAVLRLDHGQLAAAAISAHAAPTATGIDWRDGRLTVGLTRAEVDGVRRRIAALLARVDRGELRLH